MTSARRALNRVRAPDEVGAEQRAWEVVRASYVERAAVPARRARGRLAAVPAVLVLMVVLALTPAGAEVGRWISRTLGIPNAAPALLSLPAPGRVLVSGPGGTWTVAADGSTRRLGPWQQATWSPHGRFIAVAAPKGLAAVNPRGVPQWTLARKAVSDPTWYPPTGFRVAYLSARELRIVAGDGTGDHLLATAVAGLTPAWRPGHPYQLAYITSTGRLVARDADTGQTLWSAKPPHGAREITWSANGTRLLTVTRTRALVYGSTGRVITAIAARPGSPFLAGALAPNGQTLALLRGGAGHDVVVGDVRTSRAGLMRVLSGDGLEQLAWSPNGQWLLVSWPLADQWVFVRTAGRPRIAAVSHITRQFSSNAAVRGFPHVEGWCCTREGPVG